MSANNEQVGGDHYKVGGEEHWDRVERLGLDYFQGQITKYVERHFKKNGIQDLEKAEHFIRKYIEVLKARHQKSLTRATAILDEKLRAGNILTQDEARAYVAQGAEPGVRVEVPRGVLDLTAKVYKDGNGLAQTDLRNLPDRRGHIIGKSDTGKRERKLGPRRKADREAILSKACHAWRHTD